MARSKRASMREGPLADLFRSTEESVGPDEVRITAAKAGGNGSVVVETEDAERDAAQAPALEARERDRAEQSIPEPVDHEESSTDAAGGEAGEPDEATVRVVETEPEIEHEGLERLLGGGPPPEEKPNYGRREPDPTRYGTVPRTHQAVLRVVGVGGAGVNAVNRMVEAAVPGVEFVAINTDLQSLQSSNADVTLHIGSELTRGLGSGSDPRVGYRAAFEEQDKIKNLLKGSDMVFVAAGAGGGTGTGAAPVVAKLARDVGALTVGVVTKPFEFEGARRSAQADEGIAALGAEVDTLIAIPNERLLQILDRRTSITDAFRVADDVLRQAVQGISDLVMLPGLINLDFADVRTTMLESGAAILGIGMGVGEHRAQLAAEKAVSSPLLETSVEGAQSLLLSIAGGPDLSLVEASEAAKIVQEAAHPDANIIFGASIDEDMSEEVWVTVIATRFESSLARRRSRSDWPEPPPGPGGELTGPNLDLRPYRGRRDDGDRRRDRDRGRDDRNRSWSRDEDRGRGRPRAEANTIPGGRVIHVPEFLPGQ